MTVMWCHEILFIVLWTCQLIVLVLHAGFFPPYSYLLLVPYPSSLSLPNYSSSPSAKVPLLWYFLLPKIGLCLFYASFTFGQTNYNIDTIFDCLVVYNCTDSRVRDFYVSVTVVLNL